MSKSLRIEPVPNSTMVRFAWNGGGQLPEALSGSYTNRKTAEQALKQWLATQDDREVELDEQKEEAPRRGPGRPPKSSMSPL